MKNLTQFLAFCLLANKEKLSCRLGLINDILTYKTGGESLEFKIPPVPVFTEKQYLEARQRVESWQGQGIKILHLLDENYPAAWRNLVDAPLLVFCKGDVSLLKNKAISMIGARKAESFSLQFAKKLSSQLAFRGFVIVSGLAHGIDSAAHSGALAVSGKTIAILGGGFEHFYPPANQKFAAEIIAAGGLVLSQFAPDEVAKPYQFLNRNRLIAALGDILIVIQAASKSGSISTANYALELGKTLLAMPSDLRNENFSGSLDLLKRGAAVLTSVEDVLCYYSTAELEKISSSKSQELKGLQIALPMNSKIDSACQSLSFLAQLSYQILIEKVEISQLELLTLLANKIAALEKIAGESTQTKANLSLSNLAAAIVELELAELICYKSNGNLLVVA